MKLEQPLTDRTRERVEAAPGSLQSAHAAFEAKLAVFAKANEAKANAERRHAAAQGPGGILRRVSDNLEYLAGQLTEARARSQAAKRELDAAHEQAARAIEQASKIVGKLCEPLLDQFRRELSTALQPFCTDAAGTAQAIEERHTELPALHRFLHRGNHVASTAGPEEIERLTFELTGTLQSLLSGGEIWQPAAVRANALHA